MDLADAVVGILDVDLLSVAIELDDFVASAADGQQPVIGSTFEHSDAVFGVMNFGCATVMAGTADVIGFFENESADRLPPTGREVVLVGSEAHDAKIGVAMVVGYGEFLPASLELFSKRSLRLCSHCPRHLIVVPKVGTRFAADTSLRRSQDRRPGNKEPRLEAGWEPTIAVTSRGISAEAVYVLFVTTRLVP